MKNNTGMKLKGLKLLLLIPVCTFLLCVFFDIANDFYWQKRLDNFVEKNLISAMNMESIDTEEEYETFLIEKFKDTKMELYSLDVMIDGKLDNTTSDEEDVETDSEVYKEEIDDDEETEEYAIYVTVRIKHFSISGYITSTDKFTTSFLQGTFDDYNEPIVVKYKEETTEDDKVYTDEELKEMEGETSEA